jgi:hypothetical protein
VKVFLTKYALTLGIIETDADLVANGQGHRFARGQLPNGMTFSTSEWAPTLAEAKAKAEALRDAKIQQLARQIDRLRALTIGVAK